MKPCIQVGTEARNAYTKFQNSNLTPSTWKRHGRHRISWSVQTHAVTDTSRTGSLTHRLRPSVYVATYRTRQQKLSGSKIGTAKYLPRGYLYAKLAKIAERGLIFTLITDGTALISLDVIYRQRPNTTCWGSKNAGTPPYSSHRSEYRVTQGCGL